jgi:UDP-N-acetyl-D-glucosamine dehydrogenase
LYLSWKAEQYGFHTRFVELAASVNEDMPLHVIELLRKGLEMHCKQLQHARILVLGVAFKPDIEDPRNSPAVRVIEHLLASGAHVQYHDPLIPTLRIGGNDRYPSLCILHSDDLAAGMLQDFDAVVLVTAHTDLDLRLVLEHADLVIDTVDAASGIATQATLLRLGAPEV